MRIASMVYTCASVAVICALTDSSHYAISTTPVCVKMLLFSPACIQMLDVAAIVIVVDCMMDFRVYFADSKCSWAKLYSTWCLRAASLSDVIEVLSANFDMFDPEAITVLPGVLDLMVAKPRLAVK